MMAEKSMPDRTIEVFSAGCPLCVEALQLVQMLVDESWRVHVYSMDTGDAFARARDYGVMRVPAIVINGRVAACCQEEGVSEAVLRDALQRATED
jgi:glutaredoxin 3